jgi:hypothetical protein
MGAAYRNCGIRESGYAAARLACRHRGVQQSAIATGMRSPSAPFRYVTVSARRPHWHSNSDVRAERGSLPAYPVCCQCGNPMLNLVVHPRSNKSNQVNVLVPSGPQKPRDPAGSFPCSSGVGGRSSISPAAISTMSLASWEGSRGRLRWSLIDGRLGRILGESPSHPTRSRNGYSRKGLGRGK